jgi:hypothetical protein
VGKDRRVNPRRRQTESVEHRILAVNVGERLELVLLASVGAVHAIGEVADLQALCGDPSAP